MTWVRLSADRHALTIDSSRGTALPKWGFELGRMDHPDWTHVKLPCGPRARCSHPQICSYTILPSITIRHELRAYVHEWYPLSHCASWQSSIRLHRTVQASIVRVSDRHTAYSQVPQCLLHPSKLKLNPESLDYSATAGPVYDPAPAGRWC